MKKLFKWLGIGFVGLVALSAVANGGSNTKSTSGSKEQAASPSTKASGNQSDQSSTPKKASCGIKATDDCTPRVSMGHSVRVDALYWKATDVDTRQTIGDMTYALGEKADGRFVVVDLNVRSAKDESVTLTDNVVSLETSDGKTYTPDTDGTVAAVGAGEKPLMLEDIGPDATVSSKVVFDLPASALHKRLSLRFNELGFGTTKGYIKLPQLSA